MNTPEDQTPSPGDFAEQLIRQLFADLDGILSDDEGTAVTDAFDLVARSAVRGQARGSSLIVLLQAASVAYAGLVDGNEIAEPPAPREVAGLLQALLPEAVPALGNLARHADRLSRYAGETEPAAPALPNAIAGAIRQLYEGLASDDRRLSSIGLIALRTRVIHIDAIANLMDPIASNDRPVRVFPPDRFHDYFLKLTELVQNAPSDQQNRPVAALTRDGRLTAVITAADHPLEASAQAIRNLVPGDAATKEHALLRMQGLLRCIDEIRSTPEHPWTGVLKKDTEYLALVTAGATAPMTVPGRFGWSPLAQIARQNLRLMQSSADLPSHTP